MFNEFCVTSIFTDLSQKKIVIETNFKIDPASVNYENVKLVNTENGVQQNYRLTVEEKNVILIFNEYPSLSTTYLLIVSNLVDVLKRTLNSSVSKEIVFVSDVKEKVQIVKPVHNEALKINPIEIEIDAISEEKEEGINYRFEISSDVAFFNIVNSIVSSDTKVSVKLSDGQYYLRARAERQDEWGDWSGVISFVVVTSVSCEEHSPTDSEFIEDILISNEFFIDEIIETQIIEKTPNGTTDSEFYIVLNKNIDLDLIATPFMDDIDPDFSRPTVDDDIDPDFSRPHPEEEYDETDGLIVLDNINIYRRDF